MRNGLGDRLVGTWATEATHVLMPGVTLLGSSDFAWMPGRQFLIHRTRCEHEDIPDALSVLGVTSGSQLHYFDARGVYRLFRLEFTQDGWSAARDKQGEDFGQRMTYRLEQAGTVIQGTSQLSHDGVIWEDDLEIRYTRVE